MALELLVVVKKLGRGVLRGLGGSLEVLHAHAALDHVHELVDTCRS
jgi:hypothetical protein